MKNQSAIKSKCAPSDFDLNENVFIKSDEKFFEMISFGKNIVMLGKDEIVSWCEENFKNETPEDIMDGKNLYKIEAQLRKYDKKLCGQNIDHIYAGENIVIEKPSGYQYRLFTRDDISELYEFKQFYHALAFNEKIDVIAFGAFYNGLPVAVAAAEDWGNIIWIGIDTLPEHRGKGLATYLVKTVSDEMISQGISPYYCTWGANIGSINVARRCGFIPVKTFYYVE